MSRRDVGRLTVAAAAGVVLNAAAPASAQTAAAAPGTSDLDTRLALIEKGIGRTLTEEQRKAVTENIKGSDDAWTRGRAGFHVADGTEPDFVFRPTPLAAKRRRGGGR